MGLYAMQNRIICGKSVPYAVKHYTGFDISTVHTFWSG